MWTRTLGIAAAGLITSSAHPSPSDELCARLRTFEAAQLSNSDRRWFEFHWGFDKTSIWSWGCRHSEDQLAKATCDWLMDHTNQEFSMELPHRVMACHGYGFPKFAQYDWANIAGTITLRGASGRRVAMDLDYRDLPAGEQAVRLSVEDANKSYDELPAIKSMKTDGPKASSR